MTIEQTSNKGCAQVLIADNRLRSGWRVTLYTIAARIGDLIIGLLIGILLFVIVGMPLLQAGVPPEEVSNRLLALAQNFADYPLVGLAPQAARLLLILGLVWLFRRAVDKRSFRSLGFQTTAGWWQEAVAGFILVVLAWAVIFLLSLTLGAIVISDSVLTRGNWAGAATGLAAGLALNVMVGIVEEVEARGYVLQNLAEGIRFWPAVAVSSLYFTLLHFLNPGAGLGSFVGILFAGILLALGYYATGRLWFPIGLHAGWNFAQGPLFGFLVSGIDMGGLVETRVVGPDWLMGGAFGPEAGALAIAVEAVLIAILFVWGRRRQSENARVALGEGRRTP